MPRLHSFTKKRLLEIYQLMAQSRKLDEKMLILLRQGKSFFHIGCSGHEAAQLAAAEVMRPAEDWAYPYYRDLALCLSLGMKALVSSAMIPKPPPGSVGKTETIILELLK